MEHHDCQPPDVQLSIDERRKLIFCEKDRTLRAVLVGMLRELER